MELVEMAIDGRKQLTKCLGEKMIDERRVYHYRKQRHLNILKNLHRNEANRQLE
jgi:hypothetical protein